MTIDTERLKTDAAYWNEVAPLGATHYWEPSGQWYQHCGDYALAWIPGKGKWVDANAPLRIVRSESICRPTKPAEWDGNFFPPVGCECEYQPDPKFNEWCSGTFLAEVNGEYFILISGTNEVDRMRAIPSRVRQIPTKAQRNRDELADLVDAHQMQQGSFCTPKNMADAIIAAGWTKR